MTVLIQSIVSSTCIHLNTVLLVFSFYRNTRIVQKNLQKRNRNKQQTNTYIEENKTKNKQTTDILVKHREYSLSFAVL